MSADYLLFILLERYNLDALIKEKLMSNVFTQLLVVLVCRKFVVRRAMIF